MRRLNFSQYDGVQAAQMRREQTARQLKKMKVIIGSDHGAVELKETVKKVLKEEFPDVEVTDVGTNSGESVDYPDIAQKVCMPVAEGKYDRGIVLCGTGIGISIAANKIKGIRAALCHETYTAKMSRQHNNANVLAMGGRTTGPEIAAEIVRTWMSTEFLGGRHERRVNKIMALEK